MAKKEIEFYCRFTKKPVHKGECYKCWNNENIKTFDPKADSWNACVMFNKIEPLYFDTLKSKFTDNDRLFVLINHLNQMLVKDFTIDQLEEALLLIRLEYQK